MSREGTNGNESENPLIMIEDRYKRIKLKKRRPGIEYTTAEDVRLSILELAPDRKELLALPDEVLMQEFIKWSEIKPGLLEEIFKPEIEDK
jgi:hypothetical protein